MGKRDPHPTPQEGGGGRGASWTMDHGGGGGGGGAAERVTTYIYIYTMYDVRSMRYAMYIYTYNSRTHIVIEINRYICKCAHTHRDTPTYT